MFEKKQESCIKIEKGKLYAPMDGKYISLEEIPDEVFAGGMLGEGCGIIPTEGIVKAPVNGEIVMVANTKHAIGIKAEDGEVILIHIGIDTVTLNGNGFDVKVKEGDKISCGQVLMCFELRKIRQKAKSEVSAFIILDKKPFSGMRLKTGKNWCVSDEFGELY